MSNELTDSALLYISKATELNNTLDYMKDEQLDKALEDVVKIMMKPDIPHSHTNKLIVELEALAALISVKKVYYATIDKGKAGSLQNNKKNIYYTVEESLRRVVDALKYLAKSNANSS